MIPETFKAIFISIASDKTLSPHQVFTAAEAAFAVTGNVIDPATHNGRVLTALSNPTILDYVRAGRKIQAIKELRWISGCGLMEAKAAIDDGRVADYLPSSSN